MINGMKLHAYRSYDDYRQTQERANLRKIDVVWARKGDIEFLSEYLKGKLLSPRFGLCHGTRNGVEQGWFREFLGCEVIGTEISKTAAEFPNTLQWDFHEPKPEWIDSVDFIYSNAFDHSYDPRKCLDAWMACTRLCIIEHTRHHGPAHVSEVDPFGAHLHVMPYLITIWGDGRYGVRQILNHDGRSFIVIERFA